jgi:hypothetical protein
VRLPLSAEPHMRVFGCRLCWENHPFVATLRPLTAPCKARVKTSRGPRLAVHSNIGTGLRVETKLLFTRTLAHTHAYTFHTHPKRKTIEWPAFLCPLVFFPLGFVDMVPDTHSIHTHTNAPHNTGVQNSGRQHLCVHSICFTCCLADVCPDTCTHQHINATH